MKEDSIKESKTENGSGISWYWYAVIAVVLILFAPFAFRAGLRYYKKRKKGFGF